MNVVFGTRNVAIENAVIDKRNFSGREVRRNGVTVNKEGRRTFLLILSPEMTEEFERRGWKIGRFAAKEDGIEPDGFLRVSVSYFKYEPAVHLIVDGHRRSTRLDESRIGILDSADISSIDLRLSEVNKQDRDGKWKKYAYLDEGWFTIVPDIFAQKYSDLNDGDNSADSSEELPF